MAKVETDPTKAKRKFLLSRCKKLPNKPGLYAWLDKSGQPIYIGKANNINRRVHQHLDPTRSKKKTDRVIEKANDVVYKIVQQPGYMGRLEKLAVRAYKPELNEIKFK
jgi:excinuclease ABC subunit C